jgi:hypothetical protein
MLIIPVRDLAAGQASLDLDWQHASPTGGFVTSDFYPRDRVEVGHLVRVRGVWAVVQDIQGPSRLGVVHLVTAAGCLCLYSPADGATVRTDYRVARWQDIRRARAFAARWIAETEHEDRTDGPWPASDANLAQVFAGCVRPLDARLYPLLREQLADRTWLAG